MARYGQGVCLAGAGGRVKRLSQSFLAFAEQCKLAGYVVLEKAGVSSEAPYGLRRYANVVSAIVLIGISVAFDECRAF